MSEQLMPPLAGSGISVPLLHYPSISQGMAADPELRKLYSVWVRMRSRCEREVDKDYSYYGARGISVCESWRSFPAFIADMWPRPSGYTLERLDNNGHYCKENCKWASREEQNYNKRNSARLTYLGETMTIAQWSQRLGIEKSTLSYRIRSGWSADKALTTPAIRALKEST